jgi:UDP-N-acetylglucosamine 2-epimerase
MRILVAFGTRPEIIKLGPVCQALRRKPQVTMDVFWTGQHLELAAGLLDLFDIPVTFNAHNAGTSVMQQAGAAPSTWRALPRLRRHPGVGIRVG